jgi:hypothetical protein
VIHQYALPFRQLEDELRLRFPLPVIQIARSTV